MGTQETVIYRMVVRNPRYGANFSFLIFRANFGRKMGVASMRTPNGPRSRNPAKNNLTHWVDFLGQTLSRNHVFEIFKVNLLLSNHAYLSTEQGN